MEPALSTTKSIENTLAELDSLINRRRSPAKAGVSGASPLALRSPGYQMTSPFSHYAGGDSLANTRTDMQHGAAPNFSPAASGFSPNVLADKVAELRMSLAAATASQSSTWGARGAEEPRAMYYPPSGQPMMNLGDPDSLAVGALRGNNTPRSHNKLMAGTGDGQEAATEIRAAGETCWNLGAWRQNLSLLHVVNFVLFFLNIFVVLTSCTTSWFGISTYAAKNRQSTMFTPSDTAWNIWCLIFAFEILFTFHSMLPSETASRNSMAYLIGWAWPLAQLLQVCWTISFSQSSVWGAWVCLLMLWVILLVIILRLDCGRQGTLAQSYVVPSQRILISYMQWWIYYFGFHLHFGWVSCMFLMQFNVLVWSYGSSLSSHVAAVMVTSTALVISAFFMVYTRRDVTYAWVVSWFLYYVGVNLNNPFNPSPFNVAMDSSAPGFVAGMMIRSPAVMGVASGLFVLSAVVFIVGFYALFLVVFVACFQHRGELFEILGIDPSAQGDKTQTGVASFRQHTGDVPQPALANGPARQYHPNGQRALHASSMA